MQRQTLNIIAVTALVVSPTAAQQKADPGTLIGAWFEQQVVTNILEQPVGLGTIADFNLPDHFVKRLADREIIDSYHWQFHRVYDDTNGAPVPLLPARRTEAVAEPAHTIDPSMIDVHRPSHDSDLLTYRGTLPADRPALRGFRASVLETRDDRWPSALPADAPPSMLEAARVVARQLASRGLPRTTAEVIRVLGAVRFRDADDAALAELRAVGLPIDLLGYYRFAPDEPSATRLVQRLATAVDADSDTALEQLLKTTHFQFTPTRDGFVVADETGQADLQLLRFQLPVGRFFKGPGDGNPVDLVRQMLAATPTADLLISIDHANVDELCRTMTGWPSSERQRVTIVAEPMPVGQWAQDGGKAGFISSDAGVTIATVVPRFASRRDDGAEFIPSDSYLVDGLASVGHRVFQSPLLFQGGNVMSVRHPTTERHLLLLGEPELYRNMALGLGMAEVIESFRIEFGVDQVVIVPMVSFHLDYDVTVRAHRERLVAFVNDDRTAVRVILETGLTALEAGGYLESEDKARLLLDLDGVEHDRFLHELGRVVYGQSPRRGIYPMSMARHFAVDDRDSGVGNLQRFLLAIEILAAATLEPDQLPRDPQTQAYFRALKRRAGNRRDLHQQIRNLGWWVITVPSLPMAEQSMTAINGLHAPSRYYMPAWGGLYAPLDDAARRKLQSFLGPRIEIVPITTGESQRRSGALHCSIVAYPRPSR